jgi:hypothetical protein
MLPAAFVMARRQAIWRLRMTQIADDHIDLDESCRGHEYDKHLRTRLPPSKQAVVLPGLEL